MKPTDTGVRLAVAHDGTAIAVREGARVTLVELDRALVPEQAGELALDASADGYDVVWIGAPPKLLVVARYAGHSAAQLVEVRGDLRVAAEIRLEAALRVHAAVGAYALATTGQGIVILQTADASVKPYQFPARVIPAAVGTMGVQFLVALPTQIEEWDPT